MDLQTFGRAIGKRPTQHTDCSLARLALGLREIAAVMPESEPRIEPAAGSPSSDGVHHYGRGYRQALFRAHVAGCAVCDDEHSEMCITGHQLLRACLE